MISDTTDTPAALLYNEFNHQIAVYHLQIQFTYRPVAIFSSTDVKSSVLRLAVLMLGIGVLVALPPLTESAGVDVAEELVEVPIYKCLLFPLGVFHGRDCSFSGFYSIHPRHQKDTNLYCLRETNVLQRVP